MLGIPMRYLLKHPASGVADLLADPIETWTTIRKSYVAERELRRPQCPYGPDPRWEERLHEKLGVTSPCEETREFLELWPQVIGELEAEKGMGRARRDSVVERRRCRIGAGHMVPDASPATAKGRRDRSGPRRHVAIHSRGAQAERRRPSLEHRSSAAGKVLARRDRSGCWRGPCRSLDLHQGIEQAPPSRVSFISLVQLTFSFTTACTASGMSASSSIEPGRILGATARSLLTTSMPIGVSGRSPRLLPVRSL